MDLEKSIDDLNEKVKHMLEHPVHRVTAPSLFDGSDEEVIEHLRSERDALADGIAIYRRQNQIEITRWERDAGSVLVPDPRPLRVALVGCGKSKAATQQPARSLYTGNLFTASRDFIETGAAGRIDQWFVLSAQYGLVYPHRHIHPYDRTLAQMTQAERLSWAGRVVHELRERFKGRRVEFVCLAGAVYLKTLAFELEAAGFIVSQPLKGMGIGKRLQFFKRGGR